MTYLHELPHCPVCNRVLRTRDGREWCVDCHHYVDNPVIPGPPS